MKKISILKEEPEKKKAPKKLGRPRKRGPSKEYIKEAKRTARTRRKRLFPDREVKHQPDSLVGQLKNPISTSLIVEKSYLDKANKMFPNNLSRMFNAFLKEAVSGRQVIYFELKKNEIKTKKILLPWEKRV